MAILRGNLARFPTRRIDTCGSFFLPVPIVVFAIGGSTACATKKFVRTSVGEVNDKVDSLGRSLEETQERTRQNEAKIADVDKNAQAAQQAAKAQTTRPSRLTARRPRPPTPPTAPLRRPTKWTRLSKKLVFEVVLNEDQGNFKFGKTALPDEAKARLDEMVNQLKAAPEERIFRD